MKKAFDFVLAAQKIAESNWEGIQNMIFEQLDKDDSETFYRECNIRKEWHHGESSYRGNHHKEFFMEWVKKIKTQNLEDMGITSFKKPEEVTKDFNSTENLPQRVFEEIGQVENPFDTNWKKRWENLAVETAQWYNAQNDKLNYRFFRNLSEDIADNQNPSVEEKATWKSMFQKFIDTHLKLKKLENVVVVKPVFNPLTATVKEMLTELQERISNTKGAEKKKWQSVFSELTNLTKGEDEVSYLNIVASKYRKVF